MKLLISAEITRLSKHLIICYPTLQSLHLESYNFTLELDHKILQIYDFNSKRRYSSTVHWMNHSSKIILTQIFRERLRTT